MLVRVEQTTEDPMTAPTTTRTDATPPVRLEPCPAFRLDHDAAWPACETCGWLEHDHAGPDAVGGGTVTVLPRRVAPVPQRLAS
ncbi:MAG TPA: hypothetical protein VFA62_06970 [Acidimicrobiia bacterium]|nr:hypothetical protein [Acidimicrobiia bacterium]